MVYEFWPLDQDGKPSNQVRNIFFGGETTPLMVEQTQELVS